jgi:hypothetical protein
VDTVESGIVGGCGSLYASSNISSRLAKLEASRWRRSEFTSLSPRFRPPSRISNGNSRAGLVEGDQKELLEGVRRSKVDLALTYDDIEFSPLAGLPPHVLLSDIHPLAQRSVLTLQELESEPLIHVDLPLSREYFLSLFMKEGLSPNIVIRSAHQEVIRTMVANGHGYSLFNVRPRSDYALDGRKVVRVRLAGDHRPIIEGSAIGWHKPSWCGPSGHIAKPSFPTTTSLEWWCPNTTRMLPAARSNMLDEMRLVTYIRRVVSGESAQRQRDGSV